MMIRETGAGEVEAIAKESSLEAGQWSGRCFQSRASPLADSDQRRREDDVSTTSALVGVCQWTGSALAALYS